MIDIRSGIGIDIHAFDKDNISNNNFILLGGIKILNEYKVKAHSDGDILLHSISDALLGATAQGDIGVHFPPSNKEFKNISSVIILKFVLDLISLQGWKISNIDSTIISEKPKIAPYYQRIRENIANIMNIDCERISIKATTNEKMGFIGNRDGLASYSICNVQRMR